MNRSSSGVTIIELLLVVFIISTITLLSAPFYSRFLTQNAVGNTADQLVGSLRKAQIYSMMGKQNNSWGVKYVTTPSKKITLYLTGNGAFDENYTVNDNITVSGFTDTSFAKVTGIPSPGPFPLTITISGGNNTKTITINSQGVVCRQSTCP